MEKINYSWVIPIYNEAHSLPQLLDEITKTAGKTGFEIIAIDDASEDTSLTTLRSLSLQIPQLKIIHLNSRQGKWASLSLGFQKAKGEIIITLDSDLQDNPKEVKKLFNKLNQGYDMVSGWRKLRHDPIYKVLISKLGNNLVFLLTGKNFKDLNSPFKAYKRPVIDKLPTQGSLFRFSILFADRLGYKVAEIPISHRSRLYGKSKFGIVKYLRILYDLFLVIMLFSGSGRLRRGDI